MIPGLTAAAAPPALPSPGVQGVDWVVVAPVALVAAAALMVLLVEAAVPGRRRLLDAVALGGLGLAGAALAGGATRLPPGGRGTFCLPTGECSYLLTSLTLPVQALVLGGAALCLLMAVGETPAARAEHHLLLLAATCGALTLAAARDLATLVVALETASLPVVGLVALRRTASGAEAALKLLLTSVVSLGLVVTGVALLYAATGSLHLTRVAAGLGELLAGSAPSPGALLPVAVLGLLLTVSGLAFKLSAVPFHLWTPDTYAGAPVAAAAFLAVVSKAAALVALVLVLAVGAPALAGVWAPVVGVLAVASMTVGNLVALRQRVAVRLLAWSTVAQAGWVLLPLAGAVGGRPAQLRGAAAASLGYLLAYALASLAAFAVVVLVARRSPAGPGHGLDAYTGLVRSRPFEAVVLGFALACLAGLPPGVMGLVAKVLALRPVVESGSWVLAVVAAVNVALGLAYYLAWGARLFARAPVSAQVPAPASPARSPAVPPLPGRPAVAREPLQDLAASDAHAEADLRALARDRDDVPSAPGDPALRTAAGTAAAGCVLLSGAPQLLAGLLPGGLG